MDTLMHILVEHVDSSSPSRDSTMQRTSVFGLTTSKIDSEPASRAVKRSFDEATGPETTGEDLRKHYEKPNDNNRSNNRSRRRRDFLGKRIKDRIRGIQFEYKTSPKDFIEETIRKNTKAEKTYYVESLRGLSTAKATPEQLSRLETAAGFGPNYLGRTASATNGWKFDHWWSATNGYTDKDLMLPAANTRLKEAAHENLADLTQGELIFMLGQHLLWHDVPWDEFMSSSNSLLFLIVHALNRHHENQGSVTIQFMDRRKVRNSKGELAEFYPALELYETFDVPGWEGWSIPSRYALYPRKFTQEYLSHGPVVFEDSKFQPVQIEELMDHGLFEVFPAFKVPQDHKRSGLYTSQVHCRSIGFPTDVWYSDPEIPSKYSYSHCSKQIAITTELLENVQRLSRKFKRTPPDTDPEKQEPHLDIFIKFLCFYRRKFRDPLFMDWILTHYEAEDVIDLYNDGSGGVRPGFTHVAENLPEVMQYLDLVRDANFAFRLPDLPPNVVEIMNPLTAEWYAWHDSELQRKTEASKLHDENAHIKVKEKRRKRRHELAAAKKEMQEIGAQHPEEDADSEVDHLDGIGYLLSAGSELLRVEDGRDAIEDEASTNLSLLDRKDEADLPEP